MNEWHVIDGFRHTTESMHHQITTVVIGGINAGPNAGDMCMVSENCTKVSLAPGQHLARCDDRYGNGVAVKARAWPFVTPSAP